MTRLDKRTRLNAPNQSLSTTMGLIGKGLLISLFLSFFLIISLSLVTLLSEVSFIDSYIQYVMVAISITSIFIGSTYAAYKSQSLGLIIGISIGIIYVLISIGFGMKFSSDSITLLMFMNKFITGIAVGAIGGILGVNL